MSAPGAVPASMAKRLLASVIDLAVVVVLGGGFVVAGVLGSLRLGGSVTSPTPLTVLGYVLLAAQGLVQWGLLATRGYTFGKGLVGLRVLSAATGQPLGPLRALVRLAIPALAWVVPVVGPALVHLSPLFDPSGRRQGWHDRAARDMVFDITIGVDPSVSSAPSAPEAARRFDALLSTTDDSVLGRVASTGPPRGVHLAPRVPQLVVSVPGRTDHHVDRAEQAGLGARPGEALAGALHDDDADTDPRRGSGTVALEHAGALQAADRSAGADSWTTAGAYHRGVPHSAARDLSQPSTPPGADQAAPAARRRAAAPDDLPSEDTDAPPRLSGQRILPVAAFEHVGAPAPLDDEVENTRLRSARSRVAYAPSRAGRSTPRATLLLWDNRVVVLEGTALVGRNPAPREGEQLPVQIIAVVDRGRSVSKTHLALGVDEDGVWLRDRNSTNGTVVTLGDGQQILCAPEQKVRVPVGASVAFGDYWLTVAD